MSWSRCFNVQVLANNAQETFQRAKILDLTDSQRLTTRISVNSLESLIELDVNEFLTMFGLLRTAHEFNSERLLVFIYECKPIDFSHLNWN